MQAGKPAHSASLKPVESDKASAVSAANVAGEGGVRQVGPVAGPGANPLPHGCWHDLNPDEKSAPGRPPDEHRAAGCTHAHRYLRRLGNVADAPFLSAFGRPAPASAVWFPVGTSWPRTGFRTWNFRERIERTAEAGAVPLPPVTANPASRARRRGGRHFARRHLSSFPRPAPAS